MTINKKQDGTTLYVEAIGRIDTVTVTEAEKMIKGSLDGITELILDFKELDYISSAGLRLLLSLQKIMSKQGKMVVRNENETIKEIFEVTGFSEILTIE